MSRHVFSVALLSALMLLSACGKKEEQKKDAQVAIAAAPKPITKPDEPIPLASLPRAATPSHYAITVTLDPSKDRFSGHTEIDVTFNTSRKTLFIDGNELNVKSAYALLPSGKKVQIAYAQVHSSGVAYLNFGETIPAGKAKLVFDYDAPFNPSLAGLYKVVTKAGDAYAFTQFENIDARRMFP
ncbi:MAG: hypothetical protein ACTHPD_16640, partial [Rhizomicrobium sp.]